MPIVLDMTSTTCTFTGAGIYPFTTVGVPGISHTLRPIFHARYLLDWNTRSVRARKVGVGIIPPRASRRRMYDLHQSVLTSSCKLGGCRAIELGEPPYTVPGTRYVVRVLGMRGWSEKYFRVDSKLKRDFRFLSVIGRSFAYLCYFCL